jgi:hypothetical protein
VRQNHASYARGQWRPNDSASEGQIERPFFYLQHQFIKGTRFASLSYFVEQLAMEPPDVLVEDLRTFLRRHT